MQFAAALEQTVLEHRGCALDFAPQCLVLTERIALGNLQPGTDNVDLGTQVTWKVVAGACGLAVLLGFLWLVPSLLRSGYALFGTVVPPCPLRSYAMSGTDAG
eukprot:1736991-Rhodomonas_salina.1